MTDETPEIEARKDSIFRKVGRNVVNLQRLEEKLKLLQTLNYDGPLSEVAPTFERRRLKPAIRTLGQVANEIHKNLFADPPSDRTESVPWVSISIGFDDHQIKDALKKQLDALVDERNQLIHHMFGGVDFRSAESCAELEARLDGQRERVSEVFGWVQGFLEMVAEHVDELQRQLGVRQN